MSESNSTTPPRPPLLPYTFSHRGDIQGLRGVAVLLVVLYHAHAGFSGGYVGVDVFFVISGFVITAGILRQVCGEVPKIFSFRAFYARRVRRLLPSLCVASSLTLLLSTLLAPLSSLEGVRRTKLTRHERPSIHAVLKRHIALTCLPLIIQDHVDRGARLLRA